MEAEGNGRANEKVFCVIAPELHWHCTGTALEPHWFHLFRGTALKLLSDHTRIAPILH